MGFFDEFNNFIGEINSIKSDMTNFKKDFVEELHTEANSVAQTIDSTASDLRQTTVGITGTIKQATSLSQPEPNIVEESDKAE